MITRALQLVTEYDNERDAQEALEASAIQIDYLGGRVLPPAPGKPSWRVQGFYEHEPIDKAAMPDGMREVIILESQKKMLGISDEPA